MEKTTELEPGSIILANLDIDSSPTELEAPVIPKWRLICICLSTAFGLFLSLLDTTIVATALYTIGEDLKSLELINWVALAYTLSYLSCAVLFARLGDIFGRKNAFVAAFIIFLAFSLGCGFSNTLNQLIACRVLQGVGGSGLYSLTFVILPEICPPKLAQAIGAITGAVVAIAGVLGPVLGGVITRYTSWRWIFWIKKILAPLGIGPLILFFVAWPKPDQIRHVKLRPVKELDVIGAILLITASVLFVFSFQQAGIKADAWENAIFIAPLIIGCLCWIGLITWEVFVAKYLEKRNIKLVTMFPLRLMKRRVYMGYVATTLLGGFPYFIVIFNLPLRLQVVHGKIALDAGLALLPILGATALASAIGGGVCRKKDRIYGTLLLGSLFLIIGTATLSTLQNTDLVPAKMYGFEVFVGLGFGLMVSTVSLGAVLECELRDSTVSQGIIAQARMLGGSIGIAASTAILGATVRSQLSDIVTQAQLSTLETSMRSMTEAQVYAVRQAYSDSFSMAMKVCAGVSAACALTTFMTFRKIVPEIAARRKEQFRLDDEMNVGTSLSRGTHIGP